MSTTKEFLDSILSDLTEAQLANERYHLGKITRAHRNDIVINRMEDIEQEAQQLVTGLLDA